MKFDRARNNHRTAIFEVDPDTNFHEKFVATSALGTLTVINRSRPEDRLLSARLGVKLEALPHTDPDKEEPETLVPSTAPLSRYEAGTLSTALEVFAQDTPEALVGFLNAGSPAAANARAVAAEHAATMLRAIHMEFDPLPVKQPLPFGFA